MWNMPGTDTVQSPRQDRLGEIGGCLKLYLTAVGRHRWSELAPPQRASNPLHRWENQDPQKFAKPGIKCRPTDLFSPELPPPWRQERDPKYGLGRHLLEPLRPGLPQPGWPKESLPGNHSLLQAVRVTSPWTKPPRDEAPTLT